MKFLCSWLILLGVSMLPCPAAWRHQFVAPTSVSLSAIASATVSNRAVFVAVGQLGTILRPSSLGTGGNTWMLADTHTESWLRDVDFGNGSWMAVGDGGALLFSSDATAWRTVFSPTNSDWVGVTRGSGRWAVVSTDGQVLSIDDRLVAGLQPRIGGDGMFLTSLHFAAGSYVAAGSRGRLFVSTNLADWADRSLPTTETVSHVTYAEGHWLATAGLLLWTSQDASNWASIVPGTTAALTTVQCLRGSEARPPVYMVAGYNGTSMFSTNLLDWRAIPPRSFPADIADVRAENGVWMAVGARGSVWYRGESQPFLWKPEDLAGFWYNGGIPLDNTNSAAFSDINTLAGDDRLSIALGSPRRALRIENGAYSGIDGTGIDGWINGARYAEGKWVAVGDEGGVYRSTNGSRWTSAFPTYRHDQQDKGFVGTTRNLHGIDFGEGRWVCVGERGTIRTSTNGALSWTSASSGQSESLFDVRFGSGQWVAVGENQTVLGSSDGVHWSRVHWSPPDAVAGAAEEVSPRPFPSGWEACSTVENGGAATVLNYRERTFGRALKQVDFGGGLWAAVGDGGVVLNSFDGVQWWHSATLSSSSLRTIRYSSEAWMTTGDNGAVFASSDGQRWTRQTTTSPGLLGALQANGTSWIIGGAGSVLLKGPRWDPAAGLDPRLSADLEWHQESLSYLLRVSWPPTVEPVSLASDSLPDGPFAVDHAAETRFLGDRFEARLPLESSGVRFFKLFPLGRSSANRANGTPAALSPPPSREHLPVGGL